MIERSDSEVVDAVPVLADESSSYGREIVPRGAPAIVQTAAVAAGGFVAGAAVLGLVHRRQTRRALAAARPRRRIARAGARAKQVGEIAEIVASRSLLVDVHLLGSHAPSARGR